MRSMFIVKDVVNLNREYIRVKDCNYGRTQFTVKISKSYYIVEVDRSESCVPIEFYKRLNKFRNKYTKYGAEACHKYVNGLIDGIFITKNFLTKTLDDLIVLYNLKNKFYYFTDKEKCI